MRHWLDIQLARLRGALSLLTRARNAAADDSDMDDEFAFHIEMATEKNVRAGMSPDVARRAALIAFGGRAQIKEKGRDERRSRPLHDFIRDVRFGARGLARDRGFAAVTIGTIGLGIAAAVTVFTFVEAVYLRPLHVPSADRLVHVYFDHEHGERGWLGLDGARLLRSRTQVFDAVAAHRSRAMVNVVANGQPSPEFAAFVSPEYFRALGVQPRIGRFFVPSEDSVPDRDWVVVIGYGVWQTTYAGDPNVLGKEMTIRGKRLRIVGVAPEGFEGVAVGGMPNTIWLPTALLHFVGPPCVFKHPCREVAVMARLAPGATAQQVRTELATLGPQISVATFADDSARTLTFRPMTGAPPEYRGEYVALSRLLSAIAALLLVIASANLSGLLLARGLAREREIALRISLGASRGRVARQLLSESLVIGVAGGVLGTWLSTLAVHRLMGLFSRDAEGVRHLYYFSLDLRILLAALGFSIATTLAFGLVPALTSARTDPAELIKQGSARRVGARLRLGLVATQVALSLAPLVGATLLTRSYSTLMRGQRFDPRHVAMLRVRPSAAAYDEVQAHDYLRRVVERLSHLPAVEDVAFGRNWGMLWHHSTWQTTAATPGQTGRPSSIELHSVSPRFFATLRIPVLAGREFTAEDRVGAPHVALVSQALARRLWATEGDGAIGRVLTIEDSTFRIVGVVPDYEAHVASEPAHVAAFIPYLQNPLAPEIDARLAIRVRGDPAAALPSLRQALLDVDRSVPVSEMMPMSDQISAEFSDLDLGRTVMLSASAVALLLSGLGLYGVVAFLVTRRTREIGVRMALGAQRERIVAAFLRDGLVAATIGTSIGLGVAVAGARLLGKWLVDVPALDVEAFSLAALLVVGVAIVATYIPARRAAKVDPVQALRADGG